MDSVFLPVSSSKHFSNFTWMSSWTSGGSTSVTMLNMFSLWGLPSSSTFYEPTIYLFCQELNYVSV